MKYYHISPRKHRESILREGLVPRAGERARRFGQHEARIYVTDSLQKARTLCNYLMWKSHPQFANGFDIYVLHTNAKVYQDERCEIGLFIKEPVKNIRFMGNIKKKSRYVEGK